MLRRSFILGLGAALSSPGISAAREIGVRGVPELVPALNAMHAISMGRGLTVNVVVAPGCAKAGEMWEGAVAASRHCRMRWIPVGSGYADDEATVAKCLTIGTAEAVRQLLNGEVEGTSSALGRSKAADQQRLYAGGIERMMWESTGRTPAVPTMVFMDRFGKPRVIRGAIPAHRFQEVLSSLGV